jgi:predicted dehydrogenase
MTMEPIGIGIIGCGDICRKAYIPGAAHYAITELRAVADLDVDRAVAVAAEYAIPWGGAVDALLARDDIELVLDCTVPGAHALVNRAILAAGKHAYCEKPLALSTAEAQPVLDLAGERGLRVGGAPDTFLGVGLQTARRLVDQDRIGTVVGGVMHMACPGHESWHPSPEFYYQPGGGPLFDMGPYYLTTMVSILGPVAAVCGFTGRGRERRVITSQPKHGHEVAVEVDTHVAGVLHFASGAIVNLVMSFDVWGHQLPKLELYGSEGALALPDPNFFVGPVLCKEGGGEWREETIAIEEGRRGAGPADLLHAVRGGRPHRASGEQAYHVLEVMEALLTAGRERRVVEVSSRVARPAAIPDGLALGTFENV